jgi:hypothetical protein
VTRVGDRATKSHTVVLRRNGFRSGEKEGLQGTRPEGMACPETGHPHIWLIVSDVSSRLLLCLGRSC